MCGVLRWMWQISPWQQAGAVDSSLLVRKARVSAAVLSSGFSPRTKPTGTAFPGTPLCPQPSLRGKSQGCQCSTRRPYLVPKSPARMGVGNWDVGERLRLQPAPWAGGPCRNLSLSPVLSPAPPSDIWWWPVSAASWDVSTLASSPCSSLACVGGQEL